MANNSQIIRLRAIAEIIKTYRGPRPLTRQKVLDSLNLRRLPVVSIRQISRDIETLQLDYNAPIEQDNRRGYYLEAPDWTFELSSFRPEEIQTLILATELAAQHKGSPIYNELKQLTETLKERCSGNVPADLENKVEFLSPPAAFIKPEIWSILFEGLINKRRLKITYTNAKQKKSVMDIAPCKLVSIENEWYLFAVRKGEKNILQLAVRNIEDPKLQNAPFKKDYLKEIQSMLEHRFGLFACDKDITQVTVVFDKEVAYLVKSRRWQKQQKQTTLKNGDVKITFPASAVGDWPFFGIRRWVLGYGPYVKEVHPKDLRRLILDDMRRTGIRLAKAEGIDTRSLEELKVLPKRQR